MNTLYSVLNNGTLSGETDNTGGPEDITRAHVEDSVLKRERIFYVLGDIDVLYNIETESVEEATISAHQLFVLSQILKSRSS